MMTVFMFIAVWAAAAVIVVVKAAAVALAIYFIILLLSNGTIGMPVTFGLLTACIIVYLILLKILRLWNKPTYKFFGKVTK